MKNLLLNAVEELMNRVDGQLVNVRKDIRNAEGLKERMNIVLNNRIEIINKLDKLDFLKEQIEIRFPEEINEIELIEKYIRNINIQLEDLAFIVNDMNQVIEA
jgi:hypothetical protein